MPAHPTLRGHRDGPGGANGIAEAQLGAFLSQPPPSWCGQARVGGAGERFRWTVTRTRAELAALLAAHGVGDVKAIEVLDRGVSGRARAVRIVGSAKAAVVRGELRIRQTFGGLRSSMFLVDVKDGAATFRGGGFGHGVGLCQMGAIGMAEAGKTYREILEHYYLGAVLRKLW
jgi:SpoIID/LytB domain protein